MRFDFLNDTANDILELCQRAEEKEKAFLSRLNKKVTKKEKSKISRFFTLAEYVEYLKANHIDCTQELQELNKTKNEMQMVYPDINKDYEYNTLEFDEIQDMLDEDELTQEDEESYDDNLDYDEFESF